MRSTVAALTSSNEVGSALLATWQLKSSCSLPNDLQGANEAHSVLVPRIHRNGPRCAAKGTSCYTSRRESCCVYASFACTDCELPVCLWQVGGKRPKICSERPPKRCRMSRLCRAAHTGAWRRSDRVTHFSQSFMHDTCLPTLAGLPARAM